jgi:DNA-binding NtrC family response regulator
MMSESGKGSDATDIRVLILDDEPIVCDRLRPLLEKSGFSVETHTESRAALAVLAQTDFDILITDLKMQGPDGMDVLAFVRKESPRTRCIVITGFATVDTAREALRLGAVDFIAKPFRMRDLLGLVRKLADEIVAERSGSPSEPRAITDDQT